MNKRKLFIIFIMLVFILSIETASIAVIKGKVNTETVRVREEATTNSDIVKLVSIGEKVTITGESGDWYKVKVDGTTGYIRKDLLDVDEEYKSNTENEEKPSNNNNNDIQKEETNINEVNTGNESSNENNKDNIPNTSVENPNVIIGEDKSISTITLNQEELVVGAKKKIENEVKLKILPLANSNNILTVVNDAELTILEIMNSWCKVETAEGEYGWIRIDQ